MKKVLIVLAGIILLLACNDPQDSTNQVAMGNQLGSDSIPRTLALAMINHYRDTNVNHAFNHIIKNFELTDAIVRKMNSNKVVASKFFTAAYLDSNPDTNLRNKPTIILQLKVETNSYSFYYYNINSGICPPPTDCYSLSSIERQE